MTDTPDGLTMPHDPPVSHDDLRHLFDLAVDTPLVCSGSFDTDDVNVLRRIAATLGLDPNDPNVTPEEFISQYPHPHKRRAVVETPRMIGEYWKDGVRYSLDDYVPGMTYSPRQETHEELVARVAEERADRTCQAGPGTRPCGKLPDDPIHTTATNQESTV
jgi:hypothetical protein